jgi:energy-coupling factor transporter ATP-binding protein EcfA2
VLATHDLVRAYAPGTGVLGVDLVVPRDCVYGLVGPNGAGKTTLLGLLSGLRRADRGSIDLDVSHARLALVPDVPEFERWLTAAEVVALAGTLVQAPPSRARIADTDEVKITRPTPASRDATSTCSVPPTFTARTRASSVTPEALARCTTAPHPCTPRRTAARSSIPPVTMDSPPSTGAPNAPGARTKARTGTAAARRRATSRLPTRPEAPVTSTVMRGGEGHIYRSAAGSAKPRATAPPPARVLLRRPPAA